MDNAFLGPLLSAFGRSFLSKRNRGKSTVKRIYTGWDFLLVAAWGFFHREYCGVDNIYCRFL